MRVEHEVLSSAPLADRLDASQLLAALPDPSIVVDGRGELIWGDRSAEVLFGRSVGDSVGLDALEFVHPEDLELVLRSLSSIQSKEVGAPIEIRIRTPRGWRLMEVIGAPLDSSGSDAVMLTLRDLTERRRFEVVHNEDSRFRALVQNSPAVTMLVSTDRTIESVSGSLTRCLGHDPETTCGRPLADLVKTLDRPLLDSAFDRAERGSTAADPVTVTVDLIHQDGIRAVPFELALVNLVNDPVMHGFVVSGHDVTDRVIAELEQRTALSLVNATLDATADGILVTDTSGRVSGFNRQFTDMWRFPSALLSLQPRPRAVTLLRTRLRDPEFLTQRISELDEAGLETSSDLLEFLDGRTLEARSQLQRVDGVIVGRVWSFRDITERKLLESRLSHQAFHDSLTGLGNRGLFMDRLQHALERRERGTGRVAVLFLDVDEFKSVNDNFGHAVGDALLQTIARRIGTCIRSGDTAARMGGDEFGIIFEDLKGPDEALALTQRIVAEVRLPCVLLGKDIAVSVSAGIAFDEPGLSCDALLGRADLAMYAAKTHGGDAYAPFVDDMLASPSQPSRD